MSRPKSSKIYIKHDEEICDFMWANISQDQSLMLGFTAKGTEETHAMFDKDLGELRAGDFKEGQTLPNPKITFHTSGQYKLTTTVGLSDDTIDRCTIFGQPLNDITNPTLLVELLIPNKLTLSTRDVTEGDIVLDATGFPKKPWRCTVVAMTKQDFFKTVDSNIKFVSTSVIEFSHALETENYCLSFTLRVSEQDKDFPDKYYFFIPGDIKWGNKVV